MTQVVANPTRVTLSGLDDAGRSALFTAARAAHTFTPETVSDDELRKIVVNVGHPGEGAFRDRLPRLDESDVVARA